MIPFFKRLAVIFLIIGLLKPVGGIGVGEYAYAIRYKLEKDKGGIYTAAYLDQFDLINDEIVKTVRVDPANNSFTVLDADRLIFCNNGGKNGDGRVDVYDVRQTKIVKSLKIDGHTPRCAIVTKDKIIIVDLKSRDVNIGSAMRPDIRIRSWTCFEIFSRTTFEKIAEISLRDGDNVDERIALNAEKTKFSFISWNALGSGEEYGLLGELNLQTNKLLEQIDYQTYFGAGRWIAYGGSNKLYATAVETLPQRQKDGAVKPKLNSQLFIFNSDNLSLIKTIPIGILAEQLTYVPSVNRLYVAHASWDEKTPQYIEVLDCTTDKIITKIPVKGFRRMSYVGNHKLYVTHSGGPLFGSDGSGGILVIDVRTNKIIKKIPGEYAPVSYNFEPVDGLE